MGPNKAFFILITSFGVSSFGLATVLIKSVPLMFSHAVYICQKVFTNVTFTLSNSVPLILITFVTIILFIGAINLVVQVLKTRSYLNRRMGKRIPISSDLISIVKELGLKDKVDIIKDKSKLSFCYGLFQPKICLSTGLLRSLNTRELKSVLLHEGYHVKNHDPLKIILGKTASIMFFFIPVLKDFQNFYAFSKEIAADKLVISKGYKHPLLSVLSKLLVSGSPKFNGVAALASLDDLEKRVLYLTGNYKKTLFKPSLLNVSLSAFVVLFSLAIVNTPVYAVKDYGKSIGHSLFICPFWDKCALSYKTGEEGNIN